MSLRKKPKKRPRSPGASRPDSPRDDRPRIIHDRALIFRCPNSLADDFRGACRTLRQDTAIETDFARVALEVWSTRPGQTPGLATALSDFIEAHRRYDAALATLHDRFEALTFEEHTPHEHIDPIDPIADLLRAWVFYDPPEA